MTRFLDCYFSKQNRSSYYRNRWVSADHRKIKRKNTYEKSIDDPFFNIGRRFFTAIDFLSNVNLC